jgi:hypothetical protein
LNELVVWSGGGGPKKIKINRRRIIRKRYKNKNFKSPIGILQ